MSLGRRRETVERVRLSLPLVLQWAQLGISRSSLYYPRKGPSDGDLSLRKQLYHQYLETPFYGSRRMKAWLERQGRPVNRKRVQRLMQVMGLRAIYLRPVTSQPEPGMWRYAYLLGITEITRPNEVWATDVNHIPMARGFLYLVAFMDWRSRYVLAGQLAITLEADFCVDALDEALGQGVPEVFNTDQGSQFTSQGFIQVLKDHGVKISQDGKGRYQDNIFVERLWRTVKYEEIYLKAYVGAAEARKELEAYFHFYSNQRPHQALGYRTPAEVFHGHPMEVGEEISGRNRLETLVREPDSGAAGLSLNSAHSCPTNGSTSDGA